MKNAIILSLFAAMLLTGCGADNLADRVYAQAIGLSGGKPPQTSVSQCPSGAKVGGEPLILSLQGFETENCRTVQASDIGDALRLVEAQAGGRVFAGHTELIVLDGSVTLDGVQTLFFEEELSPACKVAFAPQQYLASHDSTDLVHTVRMAERNAMLPETDLSSVLDEWLGFYETALLPSPGGSVPGMVLLHKDGAFRRLTEAERRGLLYLRKPPRRMQLEGLGEVQDMTLRKDFSDGKAHFSLTMKAENADSSEKSLIEQALLTDCSAAAAVLQSENADVIGVQLLLEREEITLPARLPDIEVTVHCR